MIITSAYRKDKFPKRKYTKDFRNEVEEYIGKRFEEIIKQMG
jgi:hypothetical protein